MFLVVGKDVGHKIKGGDIAPLKIIYKKRQGGFLAGQAGQKTAKEIMEAVSGFHGRKCLNLRLRADQYLQFRDHVGDHLAIFPYSFGNLFFPESDPFITLC